MDLDETKRIMVATTEGPWEVVGNGYTDTVSGDGEDWLEVRAPSGVVGGYILSGDEEIDEQTEANLAFIAHARTAMPELVAEVERLTRWKAEASPILMDLQDLGKALRLRVGTSITGPEAAKAAWALVERAEAAEATIKRLRSELRNAYLTNGGTTYPEPR